MGYFRRKIRRKRCAEAIEAATQPVPQSLLDFWHSAPDSPPPAVRRSRFVRLAVGQRDPDSHQPQGVFAAACDVRDSAELVEAEQRELNDVFRWFNTNLPVPKQLPPQAICWFKCQSQECIAHVWQIVHLLQSHGLAVWMMATERQGKVVYEDELQVAAVPFKRTVRRSIVPVRRQQ